MDSDNLKERIIVIMFMLVYGGVPLIEIIPFKDRFLDNGNLLIWIVGFVTLLLLERFGIELKNEENEKNNEEENSI